MERICISGNIYHVDLLSKLVKETNQFEIIDDKYIGKADIVYWIGGPGPRLTEKPLIWLKRNPRLMIHWIGTDVLALSNHSRKYGLHWFVLKRLLRIPYINKKVTHLAVSEWLVDELREAGIQAYCLPISSIDLGVLTRFDYPETKDIDFITYAPLDRFEFYGGDTVIRLAYKLPQFHFVVISTDMNRESNIPEHPGNVAFYPKMSFMDVQRLYIRSKCFLRFTEHDGLSLSVLESLYHKLQVIWTYPFPYSIHANDLDDIDYVAERMKETMLDWKPNEEGRKYVIDHYSTGKWQSDFVDLIHSLDKR